MYRKTTAKCLANGTESREFEIYRGVAQGCPLSPTLFAVYINSLLNEIDHLQNGVDMGDGKPPIGILAYADDIVILSETNEELQRSINVAHAWCEKWSMKANVAKCGIQAYGTSNDAPKPRINWGPAYFPLVNNYKYLGLNFEMDMKWMKHIKKIHDAATGKLKKVGFLLKNNKLNYELKKHLYEENILSQMQYGSIAWAAGGKTEKIHKIQKKAMLLMTNLEDGHQAALEGELGIINIECLQDFEIAKFYLKVQNMADDRIPKRIFYREWTRKKARFSLFHKTKSILRKWKVNLELKDLKQLVAERKNKDANEVSTTETKNLWKEILKEHMEKYIQRRVRQDRSRENSFYRQFIPTTRKIKPYLALRGASTEMKLAATVASESHGKCPLCKMEDVTQARHVLANCGGTYIPRKKLLHTLNIQTRNFNAQRQNNCLLKIYEANPNNEFITEYTEIATAAYNLAKCRNKIKSETLDNLTGNIIDVRQHGEWYRTKILQHDQFKNNEITVDSDNLDEWPEFWAGSSFTLDLDELRPLEAVILRDSNALSFSKLEKNSGKIIYIDDNPIKLLQYIKNGIYQTKNGEINLKQLIATGQLNSCNFNGTIARRYSSAMQGASPMPTGKE